MSSVQNVDGLYLVRERSLCRNMSLQPSSGADVAQSYTLDQAKALATTALDVLYNPDLVKKMKQDFEQDLRVDAGTR